MGNEFLKSQLERVDTLVEQGGFNSRSALAKKAGVNPSTLTKKFRGTDETKLSAFTMAKLEQAAGVEMRRDILSSLSPKEFVEALATALRIYESNQNNFQDDPKPFIKMLGVLYDEEVKRSEAQVPPASAVGE